MKIKKKIITIFCGSKLGKNTVYEKEAEKLAKLLAAHNISVIYGGGKIGIMGVIYKYINKINGKITGIIPESLNTLITGSRGERNNSSHKCSNFARVIEE